MVAIEKDKKSTSCGGHHQKPAVRKRVGLELSRSIIHPHRLDLVFIAAVQDAKIQIAARIVYGPIIVVGVEDAMNHQVCKGKEERRNASRMLLKSFPLKKGVEDKARIRKSC